MTKLTASIAVSIWLLLLPYPLLSQQIRSIDAEQQNRINQLEELTEYYIGRNEISNAISTLNQISYMYWENGRPDRAAEYFQRAAQYYKELGDLESLRVVKSTIGLIYLELEDVRNAERVFTENVRISRELGDPIAIATALIDLAYVKNLNNKHQEVIELGLEAMKLATDNNYESILPNIYNNLANSYNSIGNTRQSEEFRRRFNDTREFLARQNLRGEFERREEEGQVELLRSQAESRERELQMEINQREFQARQDSIARVVRAQKDSLDLARQRDSLQTQNILILERTGQLQDAEIEKQQAVQNFQMLIIYSVIGGLILFFFLIIIMFRSNKAKQKANKELAEKNEEIQATTDQLSIAFEQIKEQNYRITQSISYAKEIQKSLFPPQESLEQFLKDSFIFFKPVDMVSGDFYWFREVGKSNKKPSENDRRESTSTGENSLSGVSIEKEKFIISAVDCTGHGVPGAFMSMIGYNLLDSITDFRAIHQADKILEELNHGVRAALNQDARNNQDGMDMGLCVIDPKEKTVEFSGANNPIIYIQEGETETIKGDRHPIGGTRKGSERVYTPHIIKVEKPTWFYILTDGYTDQFGGEKGRKLLLKNFKEIVHNMHTLPAAEQRTIMEETFENWKGKEDQLDDILVIGFKLG